MRPDRRVLRLNFNSSVSSSGDWSLNTQCNTLKLVGEGFVPAESTITANEVPCKRHCRIVLPQGNPVGSSPIGLDEAIIPDHPQIYNYCAILNKIILLKFVFYLWVIVTVLSEQ